MGSRSKLLGIIGRRRGAWSSGYFDLVIVSQDSPGFETHHLASFTLGRERYTPVVVLTRRLEIKHYIEAMQLAPRFISRNPSRLRDSNAWLQRTASHGGVKFSSSTS